MALLRLMFGRFWWGNGYPATDTHWHGTGEGEWV